MQPVVQSSWPYKLLSQQRHARLVEGLDDIARAAGVRADFMDKTMKELGCNEIEVQWVKAKYPQLAESTRKGGLLLVGENWTPAPPVRLMAMGAAFLRNYIDVKVVAVSTLVSLLDGDEEAVNPTVLIVPNFFTVSNTGGHSLPQWQIQKLQGYLMERFAHERASVLYIESEDKMVAAYGKSFHDFLWGNFAAIET